jgi:hypothetical protein
VYGDFCNAASGRQLRECDEMIVVRMDAAVTDQPDKVERTTKRPVTRVHQIRDSEERAILDRLADSHEILPHDSASTEIEMSDFGISHLAGWKTYGASRCSKQRSGARLPESAPRRRMRERHRVCSVLDAMSPAVENYEHHSCAGAL